MTACRLLRIVVFVACFVAPGLSHAQAAPQEPGKSPLLGYWLITVTGEPSTRTLIVTDETPTEEGALLGAKYGITAQGQGPIAAKMLRAGERRQIILVTQAGSQIVATEQPDGSFKGTFTYKGGRVTDLAMVRSAEKPTQALAQPAKCVPPAEFPKPMEQLDAAERLLGIGTCATARTGLWTAEGGVIVEIRRPLERCSFNTLELVVNGRRYPSVAVDDGFYQDKVWTGSAWYPVNRWKSSSGRVFFCVDRQVSVSEVQGILEKGCTSSPCLDEASAKAAAK